MSRVEFAVTGAVTGVMFGCGRMESSGSNTSRHEIFVAPYSFRCCMDLGSPG